MSTSRETDELTVLCLVRRGDEYLLQDKVRPDWRGFTPPGGHIEPNESIVEAVIREVKEETGLLIESPRLVGIKQFPIPGGRYLVFMFLADRFTGELTSSDEGKMYWVHKDDIPKLKAVPHLAEMLRVMTDDSLTEFRYVNGEPILR